LVRWIYTDFILSSDFAEPGLKKSLMESEPVPALFTDPVFVRSSYWVLSTSAIFSKHFNEYGWGEVRLFQLFRARLLTQFSFQVVPDGFGVAYMTGHNGLSLPSYSFFIVD
jgi:carnitine O-acetyltransferase